jgi:HAD superfamily hydrolase (TIGR01459 family)
MESIERKIYKKYIDHLEKPDSIHEAKARRIDPELLVKHYTCFLFDGFGTLYEGNELYQDSLDFVNALRKANKQIRLVTNSASRSIRSLQQDLWDKGLELHPQEIISSGSLLKIFNEKMNLSSCFHLGKESAMPILEEAGFTSSSNPQENIVVLTGIQPGEENSPKDFETAVSILEKENSLLILANPDVMAPLQGTKKEVSGVLGQKLIEKTKCKVNYLGKPFPLIFQKAMFSFMPVMGPMIMIGDTPGTDIAGAACQGIDTALLLRGNSKNWTEEFWEDWMIKPNYVLPNLSLN